MKTTTRQRTAAFLSAAAAESFSMAGGKLEVAQHSEQFETYLMPNEVKIGKAWGMCLSTPVLSMNLPC